VRNIKRIVTFGTDYKSAPAGASRGYDELGKETIENLMKNILKMIG